MNRYSLAAALAIQLAFTAVAAPAHAASAGIYGLGGWGSASWDDWQTWGDFGTGWDSDTRHAGGGLTLELPLGLASSYRLNIGWEQIEHEADDGGPDFTMDGLVVDQDFTFDLVASPAMRFWIGPELRLGYFEGSFDGYGGSGDYFAAGIGPVAGFDFALNQSVALSWKFGYLFTWYYADNGSWDDDYACGYGYGCGYYDPYYEEEESISEGHAFVTLSLLFRLGAGPVPGPDPGMYQPQGRW